MDFSNSEWDGYLHQSYCGGIVDIYKPNRPYILFINNFAKFLIVGWLFSWASTFIWFRVAISSLKVFIPLWKE
uniref:Truncated DNA polymerase n=1 Tax=Rhizophagus sp. DAOM 213198 TaxID=1417302 RepID=A0A0A7BVC4_9GLOM|nr:truncated DNA polymerase [Rhizophagus sp. DAOM 213198]